MNDIEVVCAACGNPITNEEYDDAHWGHEEECPRHTDPDTCVNLDAYNDCECDLWYHAACCPDCAIDETND